MKRVGVEAEALCRPVAPDVAGGPLYTVRRPDLPAVEKGIAKLEREEAAIQERLAKP